VAQDSEKELLLRGSRSDWEERERTEDQLMPVSASVLTMGSGVCLNAELKSFRGGSKLSLEYPESL